MLALSMITWCGGWGAVRGAQTGRFAIQSTARRGGDAHEVARRAPGRARGGCDYGHGGSPAQAGSRWVSPSCGSVRGARPRSPRGLDSLRYVFL